MPQAAQCIELLRKSGQAYHLDYAEPFAMLIAQLAYEGKRGPELAYRFERFRNRMTE